MSSSSSVQFSDNGVDASRSIILFYKYQQKRQTTAKGYRKTIKALGEKKKSYIDCATYTNISLSLLHAYSLCIIFFV